MSKKPMIVLIALAVVAGGILAFSAYRYKGMHSVGSGVAKIDMASSTVKESETKGISSGAPDDSLKNGKTIDEESAIAMVTALPEVKKIKDLLESRGEELVIENANIGTLGYDDNNEPYWEIHVFEDKGDRQATLGWYRVYQKSGRIESEF